MSKAVLNCYVYFILIHDKYNAEKLILLYFFITNIVRYSKDWEGSCYLRVTKMNQLAVFVLLIVGG